jgi:hypothetical protein
LTTAALSLPAVAPVPPSAISPSEIVADGVVNKQRSATEPSMATVPVDDADCAKTGLDINPTKAVANISAFFMFTFLPE